MKRFLTRLLLALSLVFNSVAVLASDFHDVGLTANLTTTETKCDTTEYQQTLDLASQHDSENCEKPCCEDSACTMQRICIVQHHAFFVAQAALKFSHPIENRMRDVTVAAVPEFRLPPENPPPIYS